MGYPRNFDPSAAAAAADTDTDQETLACLRAEAEGRNTEEAGRGLATLEVNDQFYELRPSQLPSCFVLRKPQQYWPMFGPVGQGFWKWKEGYRFAIRRDGPCPMVENPCRPDYIGMKTFLEFHLPDDTKTDWVMVEYRLIDNLSTLDDLVLCKVFQLQRKGPVPSDDAAAQLPNQVPPHPNMSSSSPTILDDVEKMFSDFDVNDHNIGGSFHEVKHLLFFPPSSVLPYSGRGNGKSEVWKRFTKIRSEDPDVVYAACHYCDRMLKAHPKKYGTSHLRRHTDKCSRKMINAHARCT